MKRCALHLIVAWLLLTASSASALDTLALLQGSPSEKLLNKRCIRTDIAGMLPVAFDDAAFFLAQPRLMQRLQEGYWKTTDQDESTGISILESAPGHYYYISGKNQRTEIQELFRGPTADDAFDVLLQASGKRFFGKYDVIIHLQILDIPRSGVAYVAEIHAYPRNMALRFFARRLGTIERYFKKQTGLMVYIARKISSDLSSPVLLPSDWSSGTSAQEGDEQLLYLMRQH